MASQPSKSTQLVQYGAVMAGAVAIPAAIKGISAAYQAGSAASTLNSSLDMTYGVGGNYVDVSTAAADAGTAAFSKSFSDVFFSPAFLTTLGLGVAGILLGSGSKRPLLSLPNLAATAAVGISVTNLLAKSKAAVSAAALNATGGASVVNGISFATAPAEDVGAVISGQRDSEGTTSYSYPLNGNAMYYMKLAIKPYERMKVTQDPSAINSSFKTIIRLPLPTQIVDALKLAYNEVGLGMFGGEALKDVGNIIKAFEDNKGGLDSRLGSAFGAAKTAFTARIKDDDFLYAVGRRALQSTRFGPAADILTGNAPNPHMAVTFQGVNLKKHTFTWRFSPDSIEESQHLQNIIRELQRAALPAYETSNKFLFTFPDVVTVTMSPSNIMIFQPCAIDSVAVNYAPNGVPSFFANPSAGGSEGGDTFERYPTEIEFSISLRELDVHTQGMEFYRTRMPGMAQLTNDEPPKGLTNV